MIYIGFHFSFISIDTRDVISTGSMKERKRSINFYYYTMPLKPILIQSLNILLNEKPP